jgi:biopolymer transport protein ExbB/TolQ
VSIVLATVSPFYAFQISDFTGRLIVLIILGMSVFAWTIIVEKWLHLRQLRRDLAGALTFFGNAQSPYEVLLHLDSLKGSPHTVARTTLQALAHCLHRTPEQVVSELRARKPLPTLTETDFGRVKTLVETAVDNEVLRMEDRLTTLNTLCGAAPFLGLLGTVWGVMLAFCGMAIAGKADIQALAPGIASALLTTVVGLIVAIPALMGYNAQVTQVKLLSIKLDNFAAELMSWLQHVQQPPAGGRP